MRRSYFFAIVIAGGVVVIFTLLFFIFDNPYSRLNPTPEVVIDQIDLDMQLPPLANQTADVELITVWTGAALGMTTGVDGQRLVFYDQDKKKIVVTEFDGSGIQELSDTLLGVERMDVSPTREQAWLRLTAPETQEAITLVYDFRAQEAVRLENGIKSIDWSPDGSELAYYVEREGASPAIKIVARNGIEPRTVRDAVTVQDPIIDWYAPDALAYWLAPSSTRPSSVITMNTFGQNAVELSGSVPAQQALFSPDGTYALVSFNDPTTSKPVMQLSTTADRTLQTLPLTTWIDKCTWMDDSARALCFVPRDLPGGFTYPEDDDATRSYRDQLWLIDAATARPQLIFETQESIADARLPFAAQTGTRLNFWVRASDTAGAGRAGLTVVSLDISDKVISPSVPGSDQPDTTQETNNATGDDSVNLTY